MTDRTPDFMLGDIEDEARDEAPLVDEPMLRKLASILETNKDTKGRLEAELKAVNATLKELEEVKIPKEMERLGLVKNNKGSFTTATGMRISLRTDVYASTVKEHEPEFFEWLRDHEAGSLIKESVHAQTLRAYVREQRENGVTVPEHLINVYEVTKAVLTKK